MYDGRQGFINYPDGTQKTSSHPLRAQIGVNGLITNSFGVLALAGWGASFYTPRPQEDFDSVIGQAELKWYITPNPVDRTRLAATLSLSSLAVGFLRDFHGQLHRHLLRARPRLPEPVVLLRRAGSWSSLEGGVAAIIYPPMRGARGRRRWTDIRIDASLFGE